MGRGRSRDVGGLGFDRRRKKRLAARQATAGAQSGTPSTPPLEDRLAPVIDAHPAQPSPIPNDLKANRSWSPKYA